MVNQRTETAIKAINNVSIMMGIDSKISTDDKIHSLAVLLEIPVIDDLIAFTVNMIFAVQKRIPRYGKSILSALDGPPKNLHKKYPSRCRPARNPHAAPSEWAIKKFYKSFEWKQARYDALHLMGAKCKCCGKTSEDGAIMHVDHIRPIRHYWHLRLKSYNHQILCAECNLGKGSRDQTDWRRNK